MVRGLFSLPLLYASLAQPIVINEVMSNPEGPESEVCDKNEFIELYNAGDGNILPFVSRYIPPKAVIPAKSNPEASW